MNDELLRDAEYCIDKYFDGYVKKQLDFLIDSRYAANLAAKSNRFGVASVLFPTEGYAADTSLKYPATDVEKLCVEMSLDKRTSHDLQVLEDMWRKAAVARVGEERYKKLSSQLGADLAKAYVSHRLMMRMVDYEVERNPIQGSVDFILDEARRSSMISYLSATTSELQQFIDKRTVERYDPSLLERGTGKVLGSLTDLAVTSPLLGVSSWATLGKYVAVDLGVGLVGDKLDGSDLKDVTSMVSAALFEGDTKALSTCRSQASAVNPYASAVIKAIDAQLTHKIVRHSSSNPFMLSENTIMPKVGLDAPKLPEIPDYVSQLRQDGELYFAMREKFPQQEQSPNQNPDVTAQAEQNVTPLQPAQQQSVTGWNGLFDTLGLSDFGSVGKNLGYVLAMLPDMLVGMFTGKSRNLKFGDNMLPIASIIAGMFVKNPLLKMLLVGLGGANLLNKAGHEALEGRDGVKPQPVRQFREYEDEVLDMRISKPAMKGSTLIATIDNIPNVITISDDAADAYYRGLLPLNTLANAVLRKYDEQQQMLQENYSRELSQNESAERTVALR